MLPSQNGAHGTLTRTEVNWYIVYILYTVGANPVLLENWLDWEAYDTKAECSEAVKRKVAEVAPPGPRQKHSFVCIQA